jgi:hypothetical protein
MSSQIIAEDRNAPPFLSNDNLTWIRLTLYQRRIALLKREQDIRELLAGEFATIELVEHRARQIWDIASDLNWINEAILSGQTELLARMRTDTTSAPFLPPGGLVPRPPGSETDRALSAVNLRVSELTGIGGAR